MGLSTGQQHPRGRHNRLQPSQYGFSFDIHRIQFSKSPASGRNHPDRNNHPPQRGSSRYHPDNPKGANSKRNTTLTGAIGPGPQQAFPPPESVVYQIFTGLSTTQFPEQPTTRFPQRPQAKTPAQQTRTTDSTVLSAKLSTLYLGADKAKSTKVASLIPRQARTASAVTSPKTRGRLDYQKRNRLSTTFISGTPSR